MAVSDTSYSGYIPCQSAVMNWAIALEVTAFWHIMLQSGKNLLVSEEPAASVCTIFLLP